MAKIDILTEVINNQDVMTKAIEENNLNIFRILDFDIRMKNLRSPLIEYVKIVHHDQNSEDQKIIVESLISEKRKLTTIWSSLKLKNVLVFYGFLIILQLITLFFFIP